MIYLMRHAESTYNKIQSDWKAENEKPADHEENPDLRFLNDPDLIDARLSQKGIEQTQSANQMILRDIPTLKYVMGSPMRRGVQTAYLSLEGYTTKLEWHLNPFIKERQLSQGDLALNTTEILEQFPFIQRNSLFKDKIWFLKFIERSKNNSQNQLLEDLIAKYEEVPESSTIGEYLSNIWPLTVESEKQMYKRVKKSKEFIREFIKTQESNATPVKDGEIILVAHSNALRCFTAEGFDSKGNLVNGIEFKNGEIQQYEIEY